MARQDLGKQNPCPAPVHRSLALTIAGVFGLSAIAGGILYYQRADNPIVNSDNNSPSKPEENKSPAQKTSNRRRRMSRLLSKRPQSPLATSLFGQDDGVEMTSFKDFDGPLTVEAFVTVLEKATGRSGYAIGVGPGASGKYSRGASVLRVTAGGKWNLFNYGDTENRVPWSTSGSVSVLMSPWCGPTRNCVSTWTVNSVAPSRAPPSPPARPSHVGRRIVDWPHRSRLRISNIARYDN